MKTHTAIAILAATLLPFTVGAAVETGEKAPDFTLKDTSGKEHSLSDFQGKTVVLEWLNYGCPFVLKHYDSGNMQSLQEKYTGKDVVWLSINSTKPAHKDYKDPAESDKATEKHGARPTAVLLDEDGAVGKKYDAKTTPHMYVINPDGVLVYQGAIDSISSTNADDVKKADNYVAAALDAVMAGKEVGNATTKPYGCSVKY